MSEAEIAHGRFLKSLTSRERTLKPDALEAESPEGYRRRYSRPNSVMPMFGYLDTVIPRYHHEVTEGGRVKEPPVKAMTLRLSDEQARELETVARVEGRPVSALVREAIEVHIAARREDKAFQSRLARLMDEDREILDRLSR